MRLVGTSRRRLNWLKRATAVVTVTLFIAPGTSALAAEPRTGAESAAEQDFQALANSSRSQSGLGPLSGSPGWLEHARNHSEEMAASNSIFHDSNLAAEATTLGCWSRIGENVGMGPSVNAIHNALMNSPTHRANILGDFDAVGVGVEISADGTIWVTQRFLKSCGGTSPAAAPVPVPAPVAAPAPAPVVKPAASTPAPAPPAPKPAGPVSKISTAAAPAPPPLEPSRSVEQERPGGHFVFDHCILKWNRGLVCISGAK
jgi:hypothetical protein